MSKQSRCLAAFVCSILMGLVMMVTPSASFAQELEQRLDDAVAEITMLKRIIAEQDRRISELEKAIRLIQSSAVSAQKQEATLEKPSITQIFKPGWHSQAAWEKIKRGMSEPQVVAILGKPTSIDDIGAGHRKLFYRGEVAGSGFVSGNVSFSDDQVYFISNPVF
jgi:hypothetical protein